MEPQPDNPQEELTVVPYSSAGWSVVLQNSVGNAVLYNRRNNQFQLSRNAHSIENGVEPSNSANALCPTCHRPLNEEEPRHAPAFMDSEYFRLLSAANPAANAEDNNILSEDEVPASEVPFSSGHLPQSAFNQGYFDQFFVVREELGRGARGVVLKVTHVLDNIPLGDYAVKRVAVGDNHEYLTRMLQEVHVLRLRHRNLINFHHVWLENSKLTNFGPPVPTLYLLQEYCDGGDLEKYILSRVRAHEPTVAELKAKARRKSRGQLEPAEFSPVEIPIDMVYSFTRDIVSGLNHLHQNGVIHRDLKPSNCLLSIGRGPIPKVLVGDFGEGHVEGSGKVGTGTIEYTAPELLNRTRGSRALSTKADMFSLGMTIHFMAYKGKLPYIATGETMESLEALRREVQTFPGYRQDDSQLDLPEELHELLRLLLSRQPDQRPTCQEVLNLMNKPHRKLSQSLSGTDRITRIDSDPDIATGSQRNLRRRLTAPGPSTLSREVMQGESVDFDADPAAPHSESSDESRVALVPSNSQRSPGLGQSPILRNYYTFLWISVGVFVIKIMSLLLPCAPFLCSRTVLYTLFGLAILDIVSPTSPRISISLLISHFVILLLAYHYNILCPYNSSPP